MIQYTSLIVITYWPLSTVSNNNLRNAQSSPHQEGICVIAIPYSSFLFKIYWISLSSIIYHYLLVANASVEDMCENDMHMFYICNRYWWVMHVNSWLFLLQLSFRLNNVMDEWMDLFKDNKIFKHCIKYVIYNAGYEDINLHKPLHKSNKVYMVFANGKRLLKFICKLILIAILKIL